MKELDWSTIGLKPVRIDKHGPMYAIEDVYKSVILMINTQVYFKEAAKTMTKDAEMAIEVTNKVTDEFKKAFGRFQDVHSGFVEQSKKASGDIRDSANKLSEGLARIEKSANFDRLERYVLLLERAAAAMNSLSELEKSGKLEKIAGALK